MPAGRPTKFTPQYIEIARNACARLGATTEDLAALFGVATSTVDKWRTEIPEFSEALKSAKAESDAKVQESLYRRAMGYAHEAVKIHVNADGVVTQVPYTERYPPDTTACIFWLKNRQPAGWRDRTEVEHKGGINVSWSRREQKPDGS